MLESPDMATRTSDGVQLFLASNSPRRKELLALGGWEYEIVSAQVDETPLAGEEGMEYVQRLAKSKAVAAANQPDVEGVIIAADTSVINHQLDGENKILGKPKDRQEAVEMLQDLRGRIPPGPHCNSNFIQPGWHQFGPIYAPPL